MKLTSNTRRATVGKSGSGYEMEVLRGCERPKGFIGLKGGLGDAGSDSLYGFAEKLVELSDGEYAVGLIATTRPKNIVKVLRGNPAKARVRRSQSVHGAFRDAVRWLEPETVILGGHSQGGISMVDAAVHAIRKGNIIPDDTSVVTIDTPSLRGAVELEESPVVALAKLGLHCAVDFPRFPRSTKSRMVRGNIFKRSSFEPIYFGREASYLLDGLDMSSEAETVREYYGLHEVYHRHDLVPGAEYEGMDFVTVFEGGHAEALTSDGMLPVINHILHLPRNETYQLAA